MELSMLSTVSNGNLIGHSLDIENFSLDSRNIKQGDLYIALQGTNFDGHDFVEEAISKGASAAVVHKSIRSDIPHILVNDTYDFMKSVALFNRSNFEGKVIGITGTNGKTSTKQILSNLLDNNNECHKTSGNKNNQIGVPFSLLNLINQYKFSVIEMGTSEPGEIEVLNGLVKPDISAITNVSKGHLAALKSTDMIAKEKGDIYKFHSDNGVAFLPRDSKYFDYWKSSTNALEIFSFGLHKSSDFLISDIKTDIESNMTEFCLRFDGLTENFSINSIAQHNAINAGLSVAIAHYCKVPIDLIKQRLQFTEMPERRLAISSSIKGSSLIDDSYNSNPASLRNALKSISNSDKRKICVLGEMKELGSESVNMHKELLSLAAETADNVICLGNEWLNTNVTAKNVKFFEDQDKLYSFLVTSINADSLILIKGSRSTRMDLIADKLKL